MQETITKPINFLRPQKNYRALSALRELGKISKLLGKDRITPEEIDEEISAFRSGR